MQPLLRCGNPAVRRLVLSDRNVILPKRPYQGPFFALAFLVVEW